MQLAVLFIHGIGTQKKDFADKAKQRLATELYKFGHRFAAETVHWAPLFDGHQARFMQKIVRAGAAMGPLRRLTVETLADALAYATQPSLVRAVHNEVTQALTRLYPAGPSDVPLIVCAHSLGGLVFADYLRLYRAEPRLSSLAAFVTFGCNIPLFSLVEPFNVPTLGRAKWLNYWDPDDCLGFPLKVLPNLAPHVEDVRVNVGGPMTWWNGLAHLGYWNDKSFWGAVARRTSGLLA